MRVQTIESDFSSQVEKILVSALKGEEINNLDNVEGFTEEIYKDEVLLVNIARTLIEKLGEYDNEETLTRVMEKLS